MFLGPEKLKTPKRFYTCKVVHIDGNSINNNYLEQPQ